MIFIKIKLKVKMKFKFYIKKINNKKKILKTKTIINKKINKLQNI